MAWVSVAVVGSSLVSSYMSAEAAADAADQQAAANDRAIGEQRRQFDAIQKLLSPYVDAGTKSLGGQLDLLGLNGADKQNAAIKALQQSPQFQSMLKQGETSILANASATGGLRGGNTQDALAKFSPSLLAQLINDQYSRLGDVTSLGQNAAAGVGNAGMQTGNAISRLLSDTGAAQAGASLAQGAAWSGGITQALGAYGALGGFGQVPYARTVTPDIGGINGGFGWKGGVGGF